MYRVFHGELYLDEYRELNKGAFYNFASKNKLILIIILLNYNNFDFRLYRKHT